MILLFALLAGLLIGLGRTRWQNQPYRAPALRSIWLVFAAFVLQFLVAYFPPARHLWSDSLASSLLLVSLTMLLGFAWQNRRLPGMPLLLTGLVLNLVAIAANGGWMPISPENASRLTGNDILQYLSLGARFGQKDILLPLQDIHFEFLADRFFLPSWFPYQVAFSLGDVLIALGIFWLAANSSSAPPLFLQTKETHHDHKQNIRNKIAF